jgi:glycosyltransferase involved in cell wall biosynthesis
MEATDQPRVVLAHDWLTGMRGGEKCLEVFCRLWPQARLYTLLHRRGSVCPAIERHRPRTSFLQRFPGCHRYYRYLLPLMPLAVGWRLPACDLVLSSSHCVVKSVRPPKGVPHICYCHTPMRYAWQMRTSYLDAIRARGLKAKAMDRVLEWLRQWDRRTAAHVTHFLANSRTVQRRIAECYGRESTVIHPPVETDFFTPAPVPREDHYLVVSAFAPYKRLDLAIAACKRLGRRLVIIGEGQEEKRLRAQAAPGMHFLGWQSGETIRDHFRRCRALLFPGEEDFGIVPVEAQACGTPVIAYGRGGATETIVPPEGGGEPTGLWFLEQSADCLAEAIMRFESSAGDFSPVTIRRQAQRFHARRFEQQISGFVTQVLDRPAPGMRRAA